ncbi:hypothetical protein D3C81_1414460 [compost metagenome]
MQKFRSVSYKRRSLEPSNASLCCWSSNAYLSLLSAMVCPPQKLPYRRLQHSIATVSLSSFRRHSLHRKRPNFQWASPSDFVKKYPGYSSPIYTGRRSAHAPFRLEHPPAPALRPSRDAAADIDRCHSRRQPATRTRSVYSATLSQGSRRRHPLFHASAVWHEQSLWRVMCGRRGAPCT